jgi:hypothetical protein
MPFTPFIGLSVLIHIGIITGHKFLYLVLKGRPRIKPIMGVARFFGIPIVVTVFLAVLITATVLIHASVIERHSSISFIKEQIGRVDRTSLRQYNATGIQGIYLVSHPQYQLAFIPPGTMQDLILPLSRVAGSGFLRQSQ